MEEMSCSRENHIVYHPSNLWCTYHDWFTPHPHPHVDTYLMQGTWWCGCQHSTWIQKKCSEAASGSLVFCWIGIQQVVIGLYDKWHNSENAIHAVSFNMFNSYSCISPMRHSMISPYSNDFCVSFIHSTQRRAPESSATPGHLQQCATG